jgi:hypothetical protein
MFFNYLYERYEQQVKYNRSVAFLSAATLVEIVKIKHPGSLVGKAFYFKFGYSKPVIVQNLR